MERLNLHKARSKVSPIDIDNYLKRLQLEKEAPSISFLKKLHKAHLLHIPYENLDIHFRHRIVLDIQKIYNKIIERHRGGIDFELNVLLFHLLSGLGFECTLGSAQIWEQDHWNNASNHPIILLQYQEEIWLIDVAYLPLFIEPKKIIPNQVQLDYTLYFRFMEDPDSKFILQSSTDHLLFKNVYRFELRPCEMIEFLDMCNFCQDSPESPHSQQKVVSQLFPNGRITLTDRQLVSHMNGEIQKTKILHEDDFATKLEEIFHIDYNELTMQRLNQ